METKLGRVCVLGCVMLSASALLVAGCGDDNKSNPSAANEAVAGSSETASGGASSGAHVDMGGADSSSHPGAGGDGNGTGRAGSGSSEGARPNVDPGGPDDPNPPDMPGAGGADNSADSPDFDGVDLSDVSETAPSGCVGGFDKAAGTLTITVGGDAAVVRVAVHAGVIQANDVDCESPDGDPAKADEVTALHIEGGASADSVYLDLSDEAFSGCFSGDGGISIALGAGKDKLTVLGTLSSDKWALGTDMDQLLMDLNGDARADVTVTGSPGIVLSTGGKADVVNGNGVALGVDAAALPLTIYGGGAGDQLVGGAAADSLFGGIGDDWFDAANAPAGADTFDGGDGEDTVDFSARTKALVITVGAGENDGEAGEKTNVADSIEGVLGGQGTNDISGGAGENHIWGGPLNDTLRGGAGSDWLSGGAGDDSLDGEAGDDFLYGEEGNDDLLGGVGDDLLDGTFGKDTLNGGPGDGDICNGGKQTACEL